MSYEYEIGDEFIGEDFDDEDPIEELIAATMGYGDEDDDDDEMAGAYEIGARRIRRRRPARRRMVSRRMPRGLIRRAAAARLAKSGAVLTTKGPTKAREYPIGLDSGANVAAGTQATVTARPQVIFRGERLVIPSDIAGNFVIDDIRVGNKSQLVATGAIPARVFNEDGTGVNLSLDTCQVAMDLVVVATNISGAATRFRGSIIGKAVD